MTLGTKIRSDLADDFKEWRLKYLEKERQDFLELMALELAEEQKVAEVRPSAIEEALGPAQRTQLDDQALHMFEEYVKPEYIATALAGLVVNGGPQDADAGRRLLFDKRDGVRAEAIRLLERFGNLTDVGPLLSLATTTDGQVQSLSARAALALEAWPSDTARSLLRSGDDVLIGVLVQSLLNRDSVTEEALLESSLNDNDDNVRLIVLAHFVAKCSGQELERLLEQYTSQSGYYYDVVCWIDRVLWSPPSLREMYRHQLKSRLLEIQPS